MIIRTALVLAGGKSRRMGRDKLEIQLDGKPVLSHVLDILSPIFDSVIVVGRTIANLEYQNITSCLDEWPGNGPLGGLITGLKVIDDDSVFLVAADLPLISASSLGMFLRNIEPDKVNVAVVNERVQPLFAVYPKAVHKEAKLLFDAGERTMMSLLDTQEVNTIEMSSFARQLYDIDTPEDLSQIKKRC